MELFLHVLYTPSCRGAATQDEFFLKLLVMCGFIFLRLALDASVMQVLPSASNSCQYVQEIPFSL
jgi:hypothetical protein